MRQRQKGNGWWGAVVTSRGHDAAAGYTPLLLAVDGDELEYIHHFLLNLFRFLLPFSYVLSHVMFRRFWPLPYLKTQNASYLYENSTVLRDLSCKIHPFASAFHNQLEWEEMVENWLHNVAKCTFWACSPPTVSPHLRTHCRTPWRVSKK